MEATGVHVKALDTLPSLTDCDDFYYEMYNKCGLNFSNIDVFCRLYKLTSEETLEAIEIMTLIANEVQ